MKAKYIIAIVLLLAAGPTYAGIIYYVDGAMGSGSYPGTQSFPLKTIQMAANVMTAGDMVIVAAGNYPERVTITKSGSEGSMIFYVANGTVECQGFTIKADYIFVKGFKTTATTSAWDDGYGFFVEGINCTIENNYVYYNPRGGISLRQKSANCTVRNNRCYRNCTQGIEIHGSNHLIENNEIWGTICHHTATGFDYGAYSDADGIRFFGSGHIFRKNYIHDIKYNDPENIGYAPHIDAFETWSGSEFQAASNILFEKNYIHLPIYQQCGVMLQGGYSYITFRNNLFVSARGITSSDGDNHHVKIQNNTFVGNLAHDVRYDVWGICLPNVSFSLINNNIFYNHPKWASKMNAAGLDISNNCIYNTDGSTPIGEKYPFDLWGVDPLFINSSALNFHLEANSPCKDSGITLLDIVDDFDDVLRPKGDAYDIGSFEFQNCRKAPSIIIQPKSQKVQNGQLAILSVQATGMAPLAYQWYIGKSGNRLNPISGATLSSYRPLTLVKRTFFWVRISNAYGSKNSRTATITPILPPSVRTVALSSITQDDAKCVGKIISNGGAPVTVTGMCWSTSPNPTILDAKSTTGSKTGFFTSLLTDLEPNTIYYVRAYAANSAGIGYGNSISLRTKTS